MIRTAYPVQFLIFICLLYHALLVTCLFSIDRPHQSNFSSFLANAGLNPVHQSHRHVESSEWKRSENMGNIPQCGVLENRYQYYRVRPFRVIVSTNIEYFNVFLNWLIFYHHHCKDMSSIFLICLDNSVGKLLKLYSLQCSYTFVLPHQHNSLSYLWLLRISIASYLVSDGFDVILSDTDATWLRNPFHDISKFFTANVIASKATFPEEIHKSVGATVCMGFVYFRASNGTVVVLNDLFYYMSSKTVPDDQRDINELLLQNHVHFNVKPSFLGNEVSLGKFIIHGKYLINIVFMPHNRFIRMCNIAGGYNLVLNSTIAHCLGGKKANEKILTDKVLGLWLLRDNWQEVTRLMQRNGSAIAVNDESTGRFFDSFFNSIMSQNVTSVYDLASTHRRQKVELPALSTTFPTYAPSLRHKIL